MPLQTSGQISMSQAAAEKGNSLSDVSMVKLCSYDMNTDLCNPTQVNVAAPHQISELFGYDHNCITAPSGTDHVVRGMFRDAFEACAEPMRSEEWYITVLAPNTDPIRGSQITAQGEAIQPPEGWYYFERGNYVFFVDREGNVQDVIPCDGPGLEEPKRT